MTTTSKSEVRQGDVDRLREIQQEMLELLSEAKSLVQRAGMDSGQRVIFERARAYWLAQVAMGLSNDHDYLGGATVSLSDTIDELEACVAGESSEEEEECEGINCNRCDGEGCNDDSGEPPGAGEDVFERQMRARYPEIRR